MGTPCIIKIEDVKYAKVYKHFDGYPEDTLKWLEDFNKDFFENRGIDSDYKFAQLLRSSARDAKKYELDDSKYTGWGVIDYNARYGVDYVYVLKNDGTVSYAEA
jgi:hypothetical protein